MPHDVEYSMWNVHFALRIISVVLLAIVRLSPALVSILRKDSALASQPTRYAFTGSSYLPSVSSN